DHADYHRNDGDDTASGGGRCIRRRGSPGPDRRADGGWADPAQRQGSDRAGTAWGTRRTASTGYGGRAQGDVHRRWRHRISRCYASARCDQEERRAGYRHPL
ncbi:uncharacterized protein METZ01_LOCUS329543, partial [marine metagenome]